MHDYYTNMAQLSATRASVADRAAQPFQCALTASVLYTLQHRCSSKTAACQQVMAHMSEYTTVMLRNT